MLSSRTWASLCDSQRLVLCLGHRHLRAELRPRPTAAMRVHRTVSRQGSEPNPHSTLQDLVRGFVPREGLVLTHIERPREPAAALPCESAASPIPSPSPSSPWMSLLWPLLTLLVGGRAHRWDGGMQPARQQLWARLGISWSCDPQLCRESGGTQRQLKTDSRGRMPAREGPDHQPRSL